MVNPNSITAVERLIDIVASSAVVDAHYLIMLYRKAIELHPKTQFITSLAFFMKLPFLCQTKLFKPNVSYYVKRTT